MLDVSLTTTLWCRNTYRVQNLRKRTVATNPASGTTERTGERVPAAIASGAEGARRVLAVLEAFAPARHTMTARELAEATSIPLPSMYRYIALLRETGFLVGDDRGAYHLSPRLIVLARAAQAAEALIPIADPVMHDLVRECGETVILVRLIAQVPVCVHRVVSAHQLRATFEPGQALPLLRGASGHVLLAGLPENRRRELLAPLVKEDPAAAVRLAEAVERVAARGWATSEEEIDRGVWAASAAVTGSQGTVGALTVPSALVRAPAAVQEKLLGQVRSAASTLSRLITQTQREQ
jgi:DNA-binding IclR family transcriptional regulator